MKLDLENKEWKEFLVSKIFSFERGKRLTIANRKNGNVPLVTAGFTNEGVAEFISNEDQKTYSNAITIDMFGNVFFRKYPFKCDDNIHVLEEKLLNSYSGIFIRSCLKTSTSSIFSYGKQFRLKTLLKLKVLLPTDLQGNPDYAFMEAYMKQKEQEKLDKYSQLVSKRLVELQEYKEVEALEDTEWGEFFIQDVATIESGRDIYAKERTTGNTPYVSATANNNGIGYFVSNDNKTKEAGCLSVNRNGSVGYSFYHQYEALFSNDCRKLRLKEPSKHIGIFISQQITRQKGKYGYGYKMGTARLKKQKIMLPTNQDNKPDFEYIENYMKGLEYQKIKSYLTYKNY